MYFRIQNATVSVTNVSDAQGSTKLLAQTTLRNMIGTKNLSEILMDREGLSAQMQVSHCERCPHNLHSTHSNAAVTHWKRCAHNLDSDVAVTYLHLWEAWTHKLQSNAAVTHWKRCAHNRHSDDAENLLRILHSYNLHLHAAGNLLRTGLITVFNAILTGRQSGHKLQCLYGNPIANNFFQNWIFHNLWIRTLKY